MDATTSPLRRPMLYQQEYLWLVFLGALDIMMTWVVLFSGGHEANAIAAWVIARAGLVGITLYKFALLLIVILVCEVVGRRVDSTGRQLIRCGVIISALPVVLAFALLWIAR